MDTMLPRYMGLNAIGLIKPFNSSLFSIAFGRQDLHWNRLIH